MEKRKNSKQIDTCQQLMLDFDNALSNSTDINNTQKKAILINLQDVAKQKIIDQILKSTKCF